MFDLSSSVYCFWGRGGLSSPPWDGRKGSRGQKLTWALYSVFEPLAQSGTPPWFPFLPCCAQRRRSHRSHGAGWQLPGITLAHRSPAGAASRVSLFPQARAQHCRLAAFPARGLQLGQAGLGGSSRENSNHKIMDCDKSHRQGDSGALGPGPGESFQPSQLGERGWARPQGVSLQEEPWHSVFADHLVPRASFFPICETGGWVRFSLYGAAYPLDIHSLGKLLPDLSTQFWESGCVGEKLGA